MKQVLHISKNKGQGLVEFALVLPILLLVMMGLMAMGHLFFTFVTVGAASREGARFGAASGEVSGTARYQDCDSIRASIMRVGTTVGVEDSEITVAYDDGPSTAIIGTCPAGGTGPDLTIGQRIVVTVDINYEPFFPIVELPTVPMISTSARTIIGEISIEAP